MIHRVHKEQLRVPAHIDYLAELRDFVTHIGKKYKLSEKLVKSFKLAIDEAATNIIRHAYRGYSEPGEITIRAVVRKHSVTFSLIDTGRYFDPNNIQDPDLGRYVQIGKKGGLGIFIMRRLMDDIDYRKTDEGNELRLTKHRPATVSSRLFKLLPPALRTAPFSLKIRFWFRSSLLLAGVVGMVYLYLFLTIPGQILQQRMEIWETIASQIRHVAEQPELFRDLSGTTSASMNNLLSSYITNRAGELYEIAIVDSQGSIIGHSVFEKTYTRYQIPEQAVLVDPRRNLYEYTLYVDKLGQEVPIYDFGVPIVLEPGGAPVGELHLRIFKNYVERLIASQRWEVTRLALLVVLVGSGAIFVLIYLVLSPLRRLAEWVRTAGQAEDIEDEIDIDPTSEVGEIAKAFTEMSTKVRESQKSLVEQERLQKEMQVAQEIQKTLLPREFPDIEGYEIAGHYEAAQLIGGDYYDFVEVDRDTLGIVVADVSGKGVPGSMVMAMIRQALRTEARGVKDAAEVLARLNELVMDDIKKGMFVTMFYVIIDSKRRRLNYASAGHNPMILYRASTGKTYYLNPRGFPIGIQVGEKDLFRKSIESDTIQLAEDDLLLLYTDGITEAMNRKRQIFGEERLLQVIRDYGHLRAKPFVDMLRSEILSFTEGEPQSDDITFVVIREKTSAQKEELRRARQAYRLVMQGTSIRQACEEVGISMYVYYNKYKKEFETRGVENVEAEEDASVEARHIAIEDKAKIFDIIRQHPEYGARRIAEELNTEKYGFTVIPENKIYDELVRLRLNTRQLREAFVARGARRGDRPMKPPGTPMLTLDGRVIIDDTIKSAMPGPPPMARHEPEPVPPPPSGEKARPDSAERWRADDLEDARALQLERKSPTREIVHDEPADDEMPSAEEVESAREEDTESFAELIGESARVVDSDEPQQHSGLDEADEQEVDSESAFEITTTSLAANLTEDVELEAQVSRSGTPDAAPSDDRGSDAGEDTTKIIETGMPIADVEELLQDEALVVTTIQTDETDDTGDYAPHISPGTSQKTTPRAGGRDESHGSGEASRPLDVREQRLIEGFRLYKTHRYQEAITLFQDIVAEFPDYKEAYLVLANAYFRAGDLDRAASTYETIKRIDPRDTFAYENMGIVHTRRGRYDLAVQEWRRLLDLDPTREDIRQKIRFFERKLKSRSPSA